MRTSRARSPFIIAAALAVTILGLGVGAAANAVDDPDDSDGGQPIVVIVRPSVPTPAPATPTPTPTPSPTPKPSGSSTSGSGSGSSPNTTVPPADGEDLPTLSDDIFSVGGVLYVSGVHTRYVPSFNPGRGEIRASFTVRNVSTSTVNSRVSFKLTNFLGQRLSTVDGITVMRLLPDETREVEAVLGNAGQWALETASYTLRPTNLVEGKKLDPVTREAVVFFLPWLILAILIAAGAAYLIVRILRASRIQQAVVDPVGEPA